MVTSDEERQGDEAQELAPDAVSLIAPVAGSQAETPPEPPDHAESQPVTEPATAEASVFHDAEPHGAEALPVEAEGFPHDGEASAELADELVEHEPPKEAGSPAAPLNDPPLADPASGSELSEDEATGRRVESLLAEAPDADPQGPQPARGEVAPLSFEPAPPFSDSLEDLDAPPPPPATSAFRDTVLNRSGMNRVGPIIAFDFDGTLTVRDSFTAFLKWREGSTRYHTEMAALAPAALKYLFDRDPGRLKAAAVRRFLRGLPRQLLNEEAAEFAAVSAPLLFRPDALKAWRRYRQDGARLLIVTASPENIVAPFARGLGADMLIATQLLFDEEDRVQGGLLGDNCRGPEKVRRIKRVLGEDVVLAAAYGDTDGDWEMLDMAEQQFMRLFVGVPGKPSGPG